MTSRIHVNLIKAMFLAILFSILIFQSFAVEGQSFRNSETRPYRGFVADFGTRSISLSSDIQKINQTSMLQAGGQVGLIFGNRILRSKIGLLGYYSSIDNTAGTTDLYTSHAAVNFYPLSWISGRNLLIEPYITGGLAYDQFKFFGYYINREPGDVNYSQADAPYLGKISQINATIGLGVEIKLRDQYDFVHLFSEVRYGHNLSEKTTHSAFSNTGIYDQTQLILGLSFGINR